MKYILAIILFVLALTVTALDIEQFRPYMDHNDIAYGISIPPYNSVWDFNNPYYWANWRTIDYHIYAPGEHDGYVSPYVSWYHSDFAEEPFDGRIEVYAVGEPLPPPLLTLLVALAVGWLMTHWKPKWQY